MAEVHILLTQVEDTDTSNGYFCAKLTEPRAQHFAKRCDPVSTELLLIMKIQFPEMLNIVHHLLVQMFIY